MCLFIAYVSDSQTLAHVFWNHLESMLKYRLLALTQKVSYSVGMGWGLRICFSKKFADIDAISLETTF